MAILLRAIATPRLAKSRLMVPSITPWRYCSKRIDPETGFVYFGRRYYMPTVGRWMTPDPAGFADGPDLYAYVHNHTLAYIDPDGQFAFLFQCLWLFHLQRSAAYPTAAAFLSEYAGGALPQPALLLAWRVVITTLLAQCLIRGPIA